MSEEPQHRAGDRAAHTDDDDGEMTLSKRRIALGVLLAVILAGGAFTAISQATHMSRITQAITGASPAWVAVCVAGLLLSYVGYTFGYRAAARADGGPALSYPMTARIVVIGAGTAILGASAGGLAVDFWALRRAGMAAHIAARRVLAVGTLEWTVLSLYACAAATLVLALDIRAPTGMALGWLVVVPVCVALAIWCSNPQRVRRFIAPNLPDADGQGSWPARARGWLERRVRRGLADAIGGVVLVRHLTAHPRRYPGAALGYPIYWAADILILYASVRAFGVHPQLISLVLAYATGFVVSSLPLPAGGAGGVEATIAVALHATGVAWTPALLGVFLYRILTFWFPALPALALIPSIRRLRGQLASTPQTDADDEDELVSFRLVTDSSA